MLWRFVLCDVTGAALAVVPRARARKVQVRLNAPMVVDAVANSDDESVAQIHTDGFPYLDNLDRTLKCFRRELQSDGTYAWKIRHAGYVYDINDTGDETTAESAFTSYSPLQRLATRKCRDAGGSDVLVIDSGDAGQLLKTQIDRTQTLKGECGLDTAGGTWDVVASQTVRWERKFIAEAATDLTGAYNGLDIVETPVDRTTGKLSIVGATSRRGVIRQNIKLGYRAAPHNIQKVQVQALGTSLANDIEGMGATGADADALISVQTDAGSSGRYGIYEDIMTSPDTADQSTLDQLTIMQLAQRKGIVPVLTITLQPGAAPPPWVDDDGNPSWDVGDVIPAVAIGPGLRFSNYSGQPFRIHGFDLSIDEEGNETLDTLNVAPAAL